MDGALEKWSCGIYLRLSTKDNKRPGEESIETQEATVRRALQGKPGVQVRTVYRDNGFTGTEFAHRPAFAQMMDDVRAGRINCVAVKDLSRLGRNYLDTGYYLERVLPAMGVRFIAVADGLDSLDGSQPGADLLVPMKNLLNEMHSRDISRKGRAAYLMRAQAGNQGIRRAAYGYTKAPGDNTRLVPHPVFAPVVAGIFADALAGMATTAIARGLNKGGWPAPCGGEWTDAAVRRVLRNPVYRGDLVFNTVDASRLSPLGPRERPLAEHIVHRGMHEALVDDSSFDQVQALLDDRSARRRAGRDRNELARALMPDAFAGVGVTCAACGGRMKFDRSLSHGTTRGAYYFCAAASRRARCPKRPRIPEPLLHILVSRQVSAALGTGGSLQLTRQTVDLLVQRVEVLSNTAVRTVPAQAGRQSNAAGVLRPPAAAVGAVSAAGSVLGARPVVATGSVLGPGSVLAAGSLTGAGSLPGAEPSLTAESRLADGEGRAV